MKNELHFYHKNKDDKIWWVDTGAIGELCVSFDKQKLLYLFQDYPKAFTKEEKDLFDKENPYWADFFKGRR